MTTEHRVETRMNKIKDIMFMVVRYLLLFVILGTVTLKVLGFSTVTTESIKIETSVDEYED